VVFSQTNEEIKEFGVYNENLNALADWLTEHKIKTVAMESTGNYWQNLYAVLVSRGFEVLLCNLRKFLLLYQFMVYLRKLVIK
jgi:transposase